MWEGAFSMGVSVLVSLFIAIIKHLRQLMLKSRKFYMCLTVLEGGVLLIWLPVKVTYRLQIIAYFRDQAS